jgi:hypothetical protein
VEDYGIELRLWQIGLLQLGSMVLLFLLIKYFVESIFNNPPSGRHQIIHSVVDAFLLDYIRHTLLSNLPYIILAFIGLALLMKLIYVFWRFLYINAKKKGWPDIVLVIGTVLYFGVLYVYLPTHLSIQIGIWLYQADIKLLVVYILSWFLIYPYATMGTFAILAKKPKTAYTLLTINLVLMIISWLIIFNLISEDIQQSIFLPSLTRMTPALLFGVMFGAYLLVSRQYIVYKFRINYSVDRFDERLKDNKVFKNRYLQGLRKTLNKSLVVLLITIVAAALVTIGPVMFLYGIKWFGPAWLSQSYELNSVYGLVLPFLIIIMVLIVGRNVYELVRDRLERVGMNPAETATDEN